MKFRRSRVALVLPAFEAGGGVPAVAMFIHRAARLSERYEVKVVSLATAWNDVHSLRLTRPASWVGQPSSSSRLYLGTPYVHVGAVAAELEFQRYRPRAALTRALVGCDLIQVVCGTAAWANAVIGLGRPVALQVATRARVERRLRDRTPLGIKGWWRKGMTEITNHLDDRALRHVDAIQVENPWMLKYARHVNANRVVDLRYAPPGIDLEHFRPLRDINWDLDPYILCVGRLDDPRKNVGLLRDAYARLPAKVRQRVRLVLAGSSSPPAAFWRGVDAAGLRDRVSFVPQPDTTTLLGLYQHATVFALASDEEGLGVVVLEAMACGVPVVSTCSGGPDAIITDGKDGFLVPLEDAVALSDRLLRLLQDPAYRQTMSHAARLTVERRYDERLAGEVFLDMWDRLTRKGEAT